jgi:hypothetical protein
MRPYGVFFILLAALACLPADAQTPAATEDPVAVATEHPRLFLRPQRLRLLRRERERSSMRWQQFAALVTGNAPLTELGFAEALYYPVAGDATVAKEAIAFAVAPAPTSAKCLSSTTGVRAMTAAQNPRSRDG